MPPVDSGRDKRAKGKHLTGVWGAKEASLCCELVLFFTVCHQTRSARKRDGKANSSIALLVDVVLHLEMSINQWKPAASLQLGIG